MKVRVSNARALELIDWLLTNDLCSDLELDLANKKLRGRMKQAAELLGLLYRIAHGCNRLNLCRASHDDWRAEAKQLVRKMKAEGKEIDKHSAIRS